MDEMATGHGDYLWSNDCGHVVISVLGYKRDGWKKSDEMIRMVCETM